MEYQWNFSFLLQQWPAIATGLWTTCKLALACLSGAIAIGLVVGLLRTQRSAIARTLGTAYVEFFRNIPALVQVFWFFYALPILTGVQNDRFLAAVTAISLYSGAYFAEIVRSGIQSIERGQWDASKALGLNYLGSMRHVVLPQAIKRILPPLTNQAIDVVKLTTLASTIAYADLLYQAKLISEVEFRPLEAYTVIGGLFLLMLIALSVLSSRFERFLSRYN